MTYLTKEDWGNYLVPKICDDKSFSEHLKQNIKIQNNLIRLISKIFITKKNSEKKLFQRILVSSMIYYHKYALLNNISYSDLSPLDKLVLFCSCIFLAFKESNKLIQISVLSSKFQPFFSKHKPFGIDEIKELIIQKEYEILLSIEFNMAIDWPYEALNLLKIYLQKIGKGNDTVIKIITYVNLYLNDSILFPLCLYYTPNEIIFSCILLAKQKYNFDFININELIKLNELEINNDNMLECTIYISKIIKYKDNLLENNNNNQINNNNNYLLNDKDILNIKNIPLIHTNCN